MQTRINDSRMRKREKQFVHSAYNSLTPPKYLTKTSKYNLTHKYCKDMGYDYTTHGNYKFVNQPTQQMKWDKQQFQYNLDKLLGKHQITKKMTGKDKWKIKQELGVSIGPNQIVKQYSKIDKIVKNHLMINFWNKLLDYTK